MTTQFACGLVVGKFAPLHHGHQYVVDTALARCKHVVLLSYSNPEMPGCDPERRECWLAQLYPQTTRIVATNSRLVEWFPAHPSNALPLNDATDEQHHEFVARVLSRVAHRKIDAVFTSEAYGEGFARYLGKRFGHPVQHVQVDRERRVISISGTRIRQDVHAARRWLHPNVYSSFVERVVVLGGESSGKSVLSAALADDFSTIHCAEFGREWWVERSGRLSRDDMLFIARRQLEREEAGAKLASRYLFCDTSPLTTLFYCRELFGTADRELELLADREYFLTVLCAPDFSFVQDGTRRDDAFRMRQHEWYLNELKRRRISFVLATGSLESRLKQIRDALESRVASEVKTDQVFSVSS